ncbi:hypothetical protein [Labilibacter marinus]|uniref:hypothetical protein n=1 Tax=Labilibacter marinus TaxID=1477105 RepID=UPI00095007CB|nr:hypothetical protein [Labilibacter marinus]
MKSNQSKVIKSIAAIAIAIFLLISSSIKIPVIDAQTDHYFKSSISQAGIAYATCRLINASVSVIQHSTVELEPAGVGVSLAVGQVLDPIDDMTERLSDVLVTAIVSLGVQKLAYEIATLFAPTLIAILLIVSSVLLWIKNRRVAIVQNGIIKMVVIITVFRLFLPLSSITNDLVNKYFFEEQIELANHELSLGSGELDKLGDFTLPKVDGIMGTIENSAVFLSKKSREFKNALTKTVENMGSMIENLLNLTFLYVGLFIIQVIILPIFSFWAMVKLSNALFNTKIPLLIKHSATQEQDVEK